MYSLFTLNGILFEAYKRVMTFLWMSFVSFHCKTFTFKEIKFQSTAFLCSHPAFRVFHCIPLQFPTFSSRHMDFLSIHVLIFYIQLYFTIFFFIQFIFYTACIQLQFLQCSCILQYSVYTLFYFPAFFSSQLTVVFISLRSPPISPQSFSLLSIHFTFMNQFAAFFSIPFAPFFLILLHSFIIR